MTVTLSEHVAGKHTVTCEVKSAFARERDCVGLDRRASSVDWPPALHSWTRTCVGELILYEEISDVVTLRNDLAGSSYVVPDQDSDLPVVSAPARVAEPQEGELRNGVTWASLITRGLIAIIAGSVGLVVVGAAAVWIYRGKRTASTLARLALVLALGGSLLLIPCLLGVGGERTVGLCPVLLIAGEIVALILGIQSRKHSCAKVAVAVSASLSVTAVLLIS